MPKAKRMSLEAVSDTPCREICPHFFCRRCSWCGYVTAEQLLTLKSQTGYEDIKIIVVIPFIGYDSKWQGQSRHRLKKLRSGTAQTVNYALHHGKTITLIHPDTMEITSPTT